MWISVIDPGGHRGARDFAEDLRLLASALENDRDIVLVRDIAGAELAQRRSHHRYAKSLERLISWAGDRDAATVTADKIGGGRGGPVMWPGLTPVSAWCRCRGGLRPSGPSRLPAGDRRRLDTGKPCNRGGDAQPAAVSAHRPQPPAASPDTPLSIGALPRPRSRRPGFSSSHGRRPAAGVA
jgi:hypothetical protein